MLLVRPRDSAQSAEGWFHFGTAVPVLAISVHPADCMKFLLWSTINESVALFPATDFEVVDGAVPASWHAKSWDNGFIELSPPEWQSPNFWERYNDDDPHAIALFESIAREL